MNGIKIMCLGLLFSLILSACTQGPKKILIFSKTTEYRHASIEPGTEAVMQLLQSKNIPVKATEDAAYFNEDSLAQFAAVIFLNTTGDVLNSVQQADFERYIQAGGGFVGIHAATDTEFHWPWYNGLVGAYFDGHPAPQDARLTCVDKADACCQDMPESWTLHEEWYNFRSLNPAVEVLMVVDEETYEGGKNGQEHPIVWKHEYDGGRAFYTGLGHKSQTFAEPLFLQQLWAGIEFAMAKGSLDYGLATTERLPEENRFSKQVLDFNLDEPMEMDELGDRGIIFVERRGAVKLYDYQSRQTAVLDSIEVFYANEDGLLGLAVDPNFDQNHWLYFFYSPNIPEAIQYVSRFTLEGDQLTDEKVLLKIPLIRKCCHSGGSLEFGADGLLYIGVGDNTNPFESSGYAPIDERPGRQLFDAQRSAANTNDLRGKILRIQPEEDGTYSIPAGNLFPEGTENCRPEIYVMGCRNPFRFSIDSKTNYLYWGDVGPDAGGADSLRGPAGMGEYNQARKAGFYGWPYSRGNNTMYVDYDFARKRSGAAFVSQKVLNNSPNNTGLQALPPIQESLIWYSYKGSKDFPWLGEGGVNPMSGPIYHSRDYEEKVLPAYFEGKWFVYEWMRDWIYVVELDEEQRFVQADPFMPGTEFSHPMDMLFSRDGQLYVLEYGQKWNTRNLDARLSVIQYNPGNRAPVARFKADREVGAAPLRVNFSARESFDHDQDALSYRWKVEGKEMETSGPDLEHVFEEPGMYEVSLTVRDTEGESAIARQKIMAGNEPPQINLHLSSENRVYNHTRSVDYRVEITDAEDGSSSSTSLDPSCVKVTFNYIPEGEDLILASVGHQQNTTPEGLQLIQASDCKACHAETERVAGPSYQEIAQRYTEADKQALIHSIIKGSQGKWGEIMMSAHPQLKVSEVEKIVEYILSLNPDKQVTENLLPLSGTLTFQEHGKDAVAGKYVLMASYLDEGHPAVEGSSLSAVEQVVFIAPRLELEDAPELDKTLGVWQNQGRTLVGSIKEGKHIRIPEISFDGLASVSIGAAFVKNYPYYGTAEIRQGSIDGPLLGQGVVEYFDEEKEGFKTFNIPLKATQGVKELFLVFRNARDPDQYVMNGDWLQFNYR